MVSENGAARGSVCPWLAAVLALSACATAPHPTAGQLERQIDKASALVADDRFEAADVELKNALVSDVFPTLPAARRHDALQLAGFVALRAGDPQRALERLRSACAMDETTRYDWRLRVFADNAAEDSADTVVTLTGIAMRWPQMLPDLEPDRVLGYAMLGLESAGSDADRYTVLSALFAARLTEEHDDDSDWWQDLALLRLARGDRAGARAALLRIRDAYVAIGVEADRRFDDIREGFSAWPGAAQIAARTIRMAAERVQNHPASLEQLVRLADLLGDSLRYEDELQVADVAIEQVETRGAQAYTDRDEWYGWLLNGRASALFALGRWDAAIIQQQAASDWFATRSGNVGEVINLGFLYARVGNPAAALATVQRVKPGATNPYGSMQLEQVKLFAHVQLHDAAAVEQSLDYLRAHRKDSLGTLEVALLATGHDEEAAQLLIARLADPRERHEALLAVQEYDTGLLPPWWQALQHRWDDLLRRSDVQEAVARVGRVAHYHVNRENH